jgi:hypothetical protein
VDGVRVAHDVPGQQSPRLEHVERASANGTALTAGSALILSTLPNKRIHVSAPMGLSPNGNYLTSGRHFPIYKRDELHDSPQRAYRFVRIHRKQSTVPRAATGDRFAERREA